MKTLSQKHLSFLLGLSLLAGQATGELSGQLAGSLTGPLTGSGGPAAERVPMATQGRSIEGRLELPGDAPHDASLTVVALGPERIATEQPNGNRSWDEYELIARGSVDPNGAFRIPVPAGTKVHALDVDGRFLYLAEPQSLDATTEEVLVLEPELGGAIRLTLTLPEGHDRLPGEIHAGGFGFHADGASQRRSLTAHDVLELELRALQPGLQFRPWVQPEAYPAVMHDHELEVTAGAVTETTLELLAGASVRGRVVDSAGNPLADVEVHGSGGSTYASRNVRTALTDADGRFELSALTPQSQTLTTQHPAYLAGSSRELSLEDRVCVNDVVIALERGRELHGTILWPDGSPASGAHLIVMPFDPNGNWPVIERAKSSLGSLRAQADGSFRMGGLQPGDYGLYAWLGRDEAGTEDEGTGTESTADESTGNETGQGDTTVVAWNARAASVTAPDEEVSLTLMPPLSLSGEVVSDLGEGASTFVVTAVRDDWPTWVDGPARKVEARFEEAAGGFALEGLDSGNWTISVLADGHLRSREQTVSIPAETLPRFVVKRVARLAGVVLDPNGHPVAGAQVRAQSMSAEGRSGVVATDAEGRWQFDAIGPGPLLVEASSEDWANSSDQSLELAAGEAVLEHRLHLTVGGTITGQVFDPQGAPHARRSIVVQSERGDSFEGLSDDAGRFRFEHLTPGLYQVISAPDEQHWMSVDGDAGMGEFFDQIRMTMATVVNHETVEVVLGAPPRAPVVVTGRVLASDGAPLAGIDLMAISENGSVLEGLRGDTSDDAGHFEITLDEPGDYTLVLLSSNTLDTEVDYQVTIPAVERHELELMLPSGSIRGAVRAPDGSSVESGLVWLQRVDAVSELTSLTGHRSATIEEDGSFAFETLQPGSYALSATSGELGRSARHDVAVSSDSATEVDLTLLRFGSISGTVKDSSGIDPAGVAGATVFLHDAHGRLLHQMDATTDHGGAFEIERVPLGEVYVSARTNGRASTPRKLVVREAEVSSVDVELTPGPSLRLVFESRGGARVRAAVRVVDAHGRDFAESMTFDENALYTNGVLATERLIGPLPSGRYSIEARAPDGHTASASIALEQASGETTLPLYFEE